MNPGDAAIAATLAGYDPARPETLDLVEEKVEGSLKLFYLRMNRIQENFIRIKNKHGRMPRTRLFEGANQCLTASTMVDTYFGEVAVRDLYRWGKEFRVYAWNGREEVLATAMPVFSKGRSEKCYRVTMADGRWIETSPDHLLLCGKDSYHTVASLAAIFDVRHTFSAFLQESNSVLGLPVRASGAVHLSQIASDCLARYFPGCRLRDERLLLAEGIDPTYSPLPDDAQGHSDPLLQMDVRESTRTSSLSTSIALPSIRDALRRFWGQCVEFSGLAWCTVFGWLNDLPLSLQQLSIAGDARLQSFSECRVDRFLSGSGVSSLNPPEYVNHIVRIELIEGQEVFDFRVPGYNNYMAGGLVNHNSGKTTLGIAEDIAHAMGFRPWLEKDDPDYRIRIKVPNVGMLGCEVAGQTLAQRIEPQFRDFIPAYCQPELTRYSDGSPKSITIHYDYEGKICGSVIHLRSYVQGADTFEGLIFDWMHWDEPPPQAVLNAAQRGKMASNAPSWFTMTPLKEPYIYDIFSLNAFNNNGTDDDIAIFRCSVWENCQDYCRDCDVTIPENDPNGLEPGQVRPVDKCPNCQKVMGFMPRAGIDNYLKTITDNDEREAREEGKWKHLSGAVYKELKREQHLFDDFTIPRDWMRIEAVDPHDARPTCWLFAAVSPEEIIVNGRAANRIYVYDYLLATGNIDSISRQVRVKRASHDYSEPASVVLDAKFGTKTVKTASEETSWEDELYRAGIKNIVLSHSRPGDVDLGHKVVKQYLQPHYSRLKGSEFPGLMFAAEGCSGQKGPIQSMFNYRWKEGSDTPEPDFKDFADCVRYIAMEEPVYKMPMPEGWTPPPPPQQKEFNPLMYGLAVR